MKQIHPTREAWLEEAMSEVSVQFRKLGFPLPPAIRVTCGFTSGGTRKRKGGAVLVGECWDSSKSADKSFEIMVSPVEDDPIRVMGILVHELCHAAAGLKSGHHGDFAVLARGMKLEGKLTATTVGADFQVLVDPALKRLGEYPHARLNTDKKVIQSTRMLKCVCPSCGYTVRTTGKWLAVGLPRCPAHGDMPVT